MSELTYAGKTFIFRIGNGTVFRNTYAADGTTLHYETIEGPTKGAEETVTLHTAEVAPGLFMFGRVEKSGLTDDGRVAEPHTGTLEPA
ncbi:hypothetical protein OG426_51010 [Streptomyces canus]|uniref:MoaF-related domain-containing protein n=1 Tax=Streptomyces canus TaxID=58343 RepID=UPI00224F0DAE|nr:hypothetical protein [Streptomyces canus]MCX4854395.1 hypothetical protein [Streptomyces canus]WSW40165.1 hypothetical protein OG426_51010 [Streptomyces canus]